MDRSQKIIGLSRPSILSQAVVMAGSVDSEASKNDDAPIRPANDRAQRGDLPSIFTEEALLQLEEGLRVQREQPERRRFSEPQAQSSRPVSSGALREGLSVSAQSEPISANAAMAPAVDQPKIPQEKHVPSPSWPKQKMALVLCALLLAIGAAALGVSLKARTGGSDVAAPVNVEGRERTPSAASDKDEARRPISSGVRSSAATPSPPPASAAKERPVEAQGPAAPAASQTSPPRNERPVEAQGPAAPAASRTSAPPNERPIGAQGAAAATAAQQPQCNIPACRRFYRSFRASDCTFQPRSGPRRICER